MNHSLRLLAALTLCTLATQASAAAIPAIGQFEVPTDPIWLDDGSGLLPMQPGGLSGRLTVGWSFTPTTDIEITSLGFYDSGEPGLCSPHRLALWDWDEQLLTTASITPGILSYCWIDPPESLYPVGHPGPSEAWEQQYPLIGDYRYAQIDPIRLMAGRTYILSGTLPPNNMMPCVEGVALRSDWHPAYGVDLATLPVSPGITIGDHRRAYEPYPATSDLICPDGPFGYDGHGLAVNFLYEPVPEPATALLMVVTAAVGLRSRRRREGPV